MLTITRVQKVSEAHLFMSWLTSLHQPIKLLAICLLSMALVACSGGGSGGNNIEDNNAPASVNLNGRVSKAPIADATVTVYRLNADGTRGDVLATTQTDANGDYTVSVENATSVPSVVVLEGGQYVDEATGATITLGSNDSLEAFFTVPDADSFTVSITPLTSLGAAQARNYLASGQPLATAISTANAEISSLFGVGDILATKPPALSDIDANTSQEELNYALHLAGFSQLDANNGDTGNAFDVVSSMAADLEADSTLGNNGSGLTPAGLVDATNQFVQAQPNNASLQLSEQTTSALSRDVLVPSEVVAQMGGGDNAPSVTSSAVTVANLGSTYTYDVDASDADAADSLSFSLTTAPAGMTIDATNGLISWTPAGDQVGDNAVTVLVTDSSSAALTDSQSFTISVSSATNEAPSITSTAVTAAAQSSLYSYDVEASDPNPGATLTFSLSSAPAGMSIDPASGIINWTPSNAQVGVSAVTVVVTDNGALTDSQGFNVTVVNVNDAPVITTAADTSATEDGPYSYDVDASDPDAGDTLSYSLTAAPTGMSIDPVSGLITWTPNNGQVGSNDVTVLVTDNGVGSLTASQIFSVTVANVNDAPAITSTAVTDATEDSVYTYDVDASDPDAGDALSFSLVSAPIGMAIDANTGVITWTPVNADVGSHSVTVAVTDDGVGTLTDSQDFSVSVANTNDAPTVSSTAVTAATQDSPYSYDVDANDPDVGDNLSFSLDTAPTGMTIDAVSGEVSWVPSNDQVGDNAVTVVVTDDGNLTDSQAFTVAVANVNDAPVITSTEITTATQDSLYQYDVNSSDPDIGDNHTYSLSNAPLGMSIDSIGGEISWTPTNAQVGNNPVTVVVTDDGTGALTDSQAFIIDVANVNDAPTADHTAFGTDEDVAYSGTLPAADPDSDTLTFSIESDPSSGSVILDDVNTGAFTYTPDADVFGGDSFTFKVNDGEFDSTVANVTVTVDSVVENVVIVAAHPDDETLMAAGIMKRALDDGDSVKVVILTNGDYNTAGKTLAEQLARQDEAKAALADTLGLIEDDIIFLGYPDGGLRDIYNDYVNAGDGGYVSGAAKSQTYGARGLGRQDFHSYQTGVAANYNRANLVADIKAVLNSYRPSRIYTHNVLDAHSDHRVVYYSLHEAATSLMKEEAQFRPDLYTQIVHSPTNYPYVDKWAPDPGTSKFLDDIDLSGDDLWPNPAYVGTPTSTPDAADLMAMKDRFTPSLAFEEPANLNLTLVSWADRVSVPVPAGMLDTTQDADNNFTNNLKFQMIDAFSSQHTWSGLVFAFGKNEEIFWKQSWSSNIAMIADITASEENAAEFQHATNVADGIVDGYRSDDDIVMKGNDRAEWASTSVGKAASEGQTLTMSWPEAHAVDKVVLYDRPNPNDQIVAATLTFSDSSTIDVGPLPNDGSPLEVLIDPPRSTTSLELLVVEVSGTTLLTGLAEMEVYEDVQALANRQPFFLMGPVASDYSLNAGASTTLNVLASDADGDAISYTWSSTEGATFAGAGASVTYEAPEAADVPVDTIDIVSVTLDDGVTDPVTTQFAIALRTSSFNAAMLAEASCSSYAVNTFNQNCSKAIDGVISGFDGGSGDPSKEWNSGTGVGATLWLNWSACYWADTIELYDRPNTSDNITGATITFGDGSSETVSALPTDGSVYRLTFTPRCVDSLTFAVTGAEGGNVGLAELIMYDTSNTQALIFEDNFNDGDRSGWSAQDNATTQGPSVWDVDSTELALTQTSSILGQTSDGFEIGTYVLNDETAYNDMDLRLKLRSDEIGVIGVMFGYQDDNNYYRFSMSKREGYRKWEKKVAGVFYELGSSPHSYTSGEWVDLRVVHHDDLVLVFFNGDQIVAGRDGSFTQGGKVALWSGRNVDDDVFFDNVAMLEEPNYPLIGINSPADYLVLTGGDLTVSAVTNNVGIAGVEFVIDEGSADEQTLSGVWSGVSYSASTSFLLNGTHEVKAYALDGASQRLGNPEAVDVMGGVGVNGIHIVGFGDSITNGVFDDLASDDISGDGRNTSGGYQPALNNFLSADIPDGYGEPVTVLDEGNPGDFATEGVDKIGTVLARTPQSQAYLVLFGTNDSNPDDPRFADSGLGLYSGDVGYDGSFKDSMQQIIDAVLGTGKGQHVYLAKVPPVPGAPTEQDARIVEFNLVIDELLLDNAGSGLVKAGPDFYDYFANDPVGQTEMCTPPVDGRCYHPTGAGYASMGRLWSESLIGILK